jgi:hypothetical protein
MNATAFETLATIRVAVGYLGERDQHAWWQSAFFAAGSRSFLGPIFGRTQIVAQCAGVTRAAAMVMMNALVSATSTIEERHRSG